MRTAITVRKLGLADYEPAWRAMQDFTARRDAATPDELWVLQHPPVYTLGVAGKPEHLPRVANGIPVVRSDRGGQITYHGPGQLMIYLLLDMRGINCDPSAFFQRGVSLFDDFFRIGFFVLKNRSRVFILAAGLFYFLSGGLYFLLVG